MGILCPTGNTVEEAWANAAAGKTGIRTIERFDTSHLENHFGGEVKNFDPNEVLGRREARRTDRVTQLGLVAAQQALEDSGFKVTDENRYDIGCIMGSGIGGIGSIFEAVKSFLERGAKAVSPLMVPMMLPDSPSSKVAMTWGLVAAPRTISTRTACA
jgi:3-oxoacyl-[acyl-carrier-protein] synthase II